ncbi:MAG: hypothetical protein K5985_07285 [Lachnospiraceae bacterium]|nr:hypothetical protein [Lachnospiraceae bacterium]
MEPGYAIALQDTGLYAYSEYKMAKDEEDTYKEHIEALTREIETLQENISKAQKASFVEKPPLELKHKKADENAMGPGAGRYLKELLFGEDKLSNVGEEDQRQIISRTERLLPALMGEDAVELGQLNPDKIVELANILFERFTKDGNFVEACEKKGAYWEYFLDRAFAGKDSDSYEGYRQKREMERLAAGVYLYGCDEYKKTGRWHLRIKGLSGDNGKGDDAATRGRDRLEMMQGMTGMIKALFESNDLKPPLSIYEFKREQLRAQNAGNKGSAAFKSKYRDYLEAQFRKAGKQLKKDKLDPKIDFMDKTYESWSSLCRLVKDNYSLYGVDHDAEALADVIGDSMSEKDHDRFLEKVASLEDKYHETVLGSDISKSRMITDDMKHYLAGAIYTGDIKFINDSSLFMRIVAADKEGCKKKAERLNDRIKTFKEKDGGLFIDTLLSDQRFLEHIAADTDTEYKNFINEIKPALDAVLKEFKGHSYFDQYILEKKGEICDIIMDHRTAHLDVILKLNELDKEIEAVKIGGKTFGSILNDRIAANEMAKEKPDQKKVKSGAEMVDAITLMGAEAVLDDRIKNLAVINRAFLQEDREQRSDEDIQARKKRLEDLEDLKKEGENVVLNKKSGRELFNGIFSFTQAGFKTLDVNKFSADDIAPNYKEGLELIMHQAEFYMNDPFLETFYATMVKKLIFDAYKNLYEDFLSDTKALLNMRVFSMAADNAISEKNNISAIEKTPLKLGLFEYFAEMLINGEPGKVESYRYLIDKLFQNKFGEFDLTGYIRDDKGGMSGGIGYDFAKGERIDQKKAREVFEKQLKEKLSHSANKTMGHLTEDDKLLMHYIMHNRRGASSAKKILSKLTKNTDEYDVGDGDNTAFIQYIKGEPLNEAVIGIDYVELAKYLTLEDRWKEEAELAIRTVAEARRVKEVNDLFVDVKAKNEVLDEAWAKGQLDCAMEVVFDHISDLKEDKIMSGKEKMWRLYTIMRAYSPFFDDYKKLVDMGTIPYDEHAYYGMPVLYEKLAEYFSFGENKAGVEKMIYQTKLCKEIGIYDETEMETVLAQQGEAIIAQKIKEDDSRNRATKLITDYLDEKTGEKHRPKRLTTDPEEKEFLPQVVAGAKAIDRYIADCARKWKGDSSANFAIEILSYPLRERLFIYYLIENEKETAPSELDCAMALTGYVPNLINFDKKLYNFFIAPVSFIKKIPKVTDLGDKFGIIDSMGAFSTSKLETGMRMLDSTKWRFSDYLKKLSDDRKDFSDKDVPEEVKVRQSLYITMMDEISRQRIMLAGRGLEEARNDPEIMRQDQRLKRLFRKLLRANDAVARLMQDEETVAKYKGMEDRR